MPPFQFKGIHYTQRPRRSLLRLYSPLEKAFTMSLQLTPSRTLNWHVLPTLNQSLPTYKFNTGFL